MLRAALSLVPLIVHLLPLATRHDLQEVIGLLLTNHSLAIQLIYLFHFTCPQRNGTLPEVYTIHTGHDNWQNFGYYDRINGMETLPFWPESPCNNIRASEGSLFPPRALTGEDTVYVYDKDVCRTLPFTYTKPVSQNGMWEAFIFYRGVLASVC